MMRSRLPGERGGCGLRPALPQPPGYTPGRALTRALTHRIDTLILTLYEDWHPKGSPDFSLVALGGYGRKELCPASDIDLLLLIGSACSKTGLDELVGTLIYPLWDHGLQASYSIRTPSQARKDQGNDFFFQTALIDARYLCGSPGPLAELKRMAKAPPSLRQRRTFLRELERRDTERHFRFTDGAYMLEPHVKDGQGALRDVHSIHWAARFLLGTSHLDELLSLGILCALDLKELQEANDFITWIRFQLHLMAGRRCERLLIMQQEEVAKRLGDSGEGRLSPQEYLLRTYHRHALAIKSVHQAFFLHLNQQIGSKRHPALPRSTDALTLTPAERMLPLFAVLATGRAALTTPERLFIRSHLGLVASLGRQAPSARTFLEILAAPGAQAALTAMLETGFLERFLPDFAHLRGYMQTDGYHTRTIDHHCVGCVGEIMALMRARPVLAVPEALRQPLLLAALLHDIGKGSGKGHAARGAALAGGIAGGLGLEDEQVRLVEFLVRHHLVLMRTALMRDLTEENVAADCARLAGDRQRLVMLYLLSVADARATGKEAWNEWRETLLDELFSKAIHLFEHGFLCGTLTPGILERRWGELLERVPAELGETQRGRLWTLPQAYILATPVSRIIGHLELSAHLKRDDELVYQAQPHHARVRLTLITRDRPGLFALLTGLLALNHLDILSAKAFTWQDNLAVDIFDVTPPWNDYNEWDRLSDLFRLSLQGAFDIGGRIAHLRPLAEDGRRIGTGSGARITFDNATSDFFTLIGIDAPDRSGLLYHAASVMSASGLTIHRAFATSKGGQVTDVFYVTDARGEKIEDPRIQHDLQTALAAAL